MTYYIFLKKIKFFIFLFLFNFMGMLVVWYPSDNQVRGFLFFILFIHHEKIIYSLTIPLFFFPYCLYLYFKFVKINTVKSSFIYFLNSIFWFAILYSISWISILFILGIYLDLGIVKSL